MLLQLDVCCTLAMLCWHCQAGQRPRWWSEAVGARLHCTGLLGGQCLTSSAAAEALVAKLGQKTSAAGSRLGVLVYGTAPNLSRGILPWRLG